MIKLYDVVRIKDTCITGIVINISSMNGKTVYTVENNRRGLDKVICNVLKPRLPQLFLKPRMRAHQNWDTLLWNSWIH